jgi:drug/metabolite transporter (DMT)-like permease
VILTLQPVLAVLISTAFLGETLVLQQWLGGLLVVLAIILLQRCPNRKP